MLLLQEGVNQIYITVSELNLINNPIYTIEIKDETSHEIKTITVLDTSNNPIRYNQFEITLVRNIADEDLANGIVYLKTGKHTYKAITVDPDDDMDPIICEVGIVKVLTSMKTNIVSYTDDLPPQEYKSYTGAINHPIN